MEKILGFFGKIIIAIVPFFWKRYVARPKVTIEFINDGGSSTPLGLSEKNKVDEQGNNDSDTAINIFELIWKYKIKVTNNSELTAYYPEFTFNPNGPIISIIDNLNSLHPIKPNETLELKAEYKKNEEKIGRERTDVPRQIPEEFEGLGILLTYQNSYKSKFYTLFNFNEKKNLFLNRRPTGYKNNYPFL